MTKEVTFIFAAITEEEFYGGRSSSRRATTESNCEEELGVSTSTPPSPQSLQPHPTYHEADSSDYNPHKKLTHVSSLSAPEVNKVSPTNSRSESDTNTDCTNNDRVDVSAAMADSSSVSPPCVITPANSEVDAMSCVMADSSSVSPSVVAPLPADVDPAAVLFEANKVSPSTHTIHAPIPVDTNRLEDSPVNHSSPIAVDSLEASHIENQQPAPLLTSTPSVKPKGPDTLQARIIPETAAMPCQISPIPSKCESSHLVETTGSLEPRQSVNPETRLSSNPLDSSSETLTSHPPSPPIRPKRSRIFRKRLPRISLLSPFRRLFAPRSTPNLHDGSGKPVLRRQKAKEEWRKSFPEGRQVDRQDEAKAEQWRHSMPGLLESTQHEDSSYGSPVILTHSFDILPAGESNLDLRHRQKQSGISHMIDESFDSQEQMASAHNQTNSILEPNENVEQASALTSQVNTSEDGNECLTSQQPTSLALKALGTMQPLETSVAQQEANPEANCSSNCENVEDSETPRPKYLRVWRESLSQAYSTDMSKASVPEYPIPNFTEGDRLDAETEREKRYRLASESRDDDLLAEDEFGSEKEEKLRADIVKERKEIEGEEGQTLKRMKERLSKIDENEYTTELMKEKEEIDGRSEDMSENSCMEAMIVDNTATTNGHQKDDYEKVELGIARKNTAYNGEELLQEGTLVDRSDGSEQLVQSRQTESAKPKGQHKLGNHIDTAEIIHGPKYEDEDISDSETPAPASKPRSGFSKWLSSGSTYTYNPTQGVFRYDGDSEEGVLVMPLPAEPPSITGAIASKISVVKDKVINDVIPAIPPLKKVNLEKLSKKKKEKPVRGHVVPMDDIPQAPLYFPPSLSDTANPPSMSSSVVSLQDSEEYEEDREEEREEALVRPHRPKNVVSKWWNSSMPSKYTYHPSQGVLKHNLESLYAIDYSKASRGSVGELMNRMSCLMRIPNSPQVEDKDGSTVPVLVLPKPNEDQAGSDGTVPVVILPKTEQEAVPSSSTHPKVPVLIVPAEAEVTKPPAPLEQPLILYPLPRELQDDRSISATVPMKQASLPPSIKQPIIIYPIKPSEELKPSTEKEDQEQKEEVVPIVTAPKPQPVILYSPPSAAKAQKTADSSEQHAPTSPTASAIAQPLMLPVAETLPNPPLLPVHVEKASTLPRSRPEADASAQPLILPSFQTQSSPSQFAPVEKASTLPRTRPAADTKPVVTLRPKPVQSSKKEWRQSFPSQSFPRPSILYGLECSHPHDSMPDLKYMPPKRRIHKLQKTLSSPNEMYEYPSGDEPSTLPKDWRLSLPPDSNVKPLHWRDSLPCPPPPDAISLPRWRMWRDTFPLEHAAHPSPRTHTDPLSLGRPGSFHTEHRELRASTTLRQGQQEAEELLQMTQVGGLILKTRVMVNNLSKSFLAKEVHLASVLIRMNGQSLSRI